MEKWDIHENSKQLEAGLRLVAESTLSERNKELIRDFINSCILENITPGRLKKYAVMLRDWAFWLSNDLDKCSQKDIEAVAIKLLSNQIKPQSEAKSNFSDWTKRDYFVSIRKFYKNLGMPDVVSKIKSIKKPQGKHTENDLLTEEELTKIRSEINHPRDLCFFDMLEESGCRIGEIATIKIKDLGFDQYGTKLLVDGKTGVRPLRLCKSTSSITKWLSLHPLRENPESYLFVTLGGAHKPLTYSALKQIIQKNFRKARVTKKSNPHFAFRHRRATILASAGWTEYQLCQWMGWIIGSPIASVYVKQSGKHIEEAALRFAGLRKAEEENIKPTVTRCPRCELLNEAEAKFCSRCGAALDLRTAITANEYNEKKSLVASQILETGIDLKTNEGKEQALKLIEELKAKILLHS